MNCFDRSPNIPSSKPELEPPPNGFVESVFRGRYRNERLSLSETLWSILNTYPSQGVVWLPVAR